VARWTLALPTSLAELPNYATRRRARPRQRFEAGVTTSRYPQAATFVRVSDQGPDESFNEAEEIAYLQATPVETVLGNHLFVLLQLAALRLGESPPNLPAAQLVIDTVAAMLSAGGARLGEHVDLYRSALAEVQQAYVRATTSSN